MKRIRVQQQRAIFCLALFVLIASALSVQADSPAPATQPFKTTAHQLLKLEAEIAPISNAKIALLDQILADAKERVVFDPNITNVEQRRQQILKALSQIDDVLTDHNIIYPPGDWIDTLGQGLTPHQLKPDELQAALAQANGRRKARIRDHQKEDFYYMDCDILSLLYLSIGQVIGFDLRMVSAPHHNFVRYQLDATHHINWETTIPAETPDSRYFTPELTRWAVREGAYLASMTDQQVLGWFYGCRGQVCEKLSPPNYKQAAADYGKAIELYPQSAGPRNDLAWLYVSVPGFWQGSKDDAVQLSLRSLSIDPQDGNQYDTAACAFAEAGNFPAAIAFERMAIEKFVVTNPAHAGDAEKFKKELLGFEQHKTYLQQLTELAEKSSPDQK